MNFFRIWLVFAVIGVLVGCANREHADLVGEADLSSARVFYVEHFEPDKRQFHNTIADQIVVAGYQATSGEAGKAPQDADVVVTYKDKWMWDITNYMIELTITFRDPNGGFPLAVGESYHTSLTRLSPEAMIEEVITNMFEEIENARK